MNFYPLSADEKPSILFRVEYRGNRSGNRSVNGRGDLCARRTTHGGAPRWFDFDNHLSWTRVPTGLLSFSSSWGRTMNWRKRFEIQGRQDIVVIAVWAKGLTGVYSAQSVASMLGYSDTGPDRRRRIQHHRDEYLVEGGITADEYRILAVFEGGGKGRDVVFEYPLYKAPTTIPDGFFPGRRSNNALEDLGDEIYRYSGVRDDMKRDELVKSIMGPIPAFLYPTFQYRC
ncbi:hypothetical protein DTO282E5_2707 [Paecilomyces variotii]|nr:hypothetical protein DTO282E5_2707 [Paecilomyces variotii]